MHRSRSNQAAIKYQPAGNRNPGISLKRLLESYIETGISQEVHILCKHDNDDDDDDDDDDADDVYLFNLRIILQ
jgi:hypothetical protein